MYQGVMNQLKRIAKNGSNIEYNKLPISSGTSRIQRFIHRFLTDFFLDFEEIQENVVAWSFVFDLHETSNNFVFEKSHELFQNIFLFFLFTLLLCWSIPSFSFFYWSILMNVMEFLAAQFKLFFFNSRGEWD